jgi:hypothetical protein
LPGFGLGTGTTAIQFRPGETTKVVTVNVAGDLTAESDETFQVALTNPNGAAILTGAAYGAILNDDSVGPSTLLIAATDGTKAEGNTGTTAVSFTVYRGGDVSAAATVDYAVAGSGPNPADTADFGGTLPKGTVSFAAGASSQVITFSIAGDAAFELDEGYVVSLSNPTGGTIVLADAPGTILNDDGAAAPTLSIAALDAVKNEGFNGATTYTYVITRGGNTAVASSVEFTVSGFGSNPATADDFVGGVFPDVHALVDAEPDGQPSFGATGDGNDDNGVVLSGITPGGTGQASVTVSLGGNTAGYLQGFIDFNRDGDWDDPGEKIISDRLLGAGTTNITFPIPANAALGTTYARFRYGYERGLGPTGPALAGEVEDYQVTALANTPVANDDAFGARFGTQLIKQGSSNNRLDVLANDFGILVGNPPISIPPTIDLTTLPATTTLGGTLSVATDAALGRDVIIYTPAPSAIGIDTFQYQVMANGLVSNFATVQIDITASDPKAVDDLRVVPFVASPTTQRLPGPGLTANDISPDILNTRITTVTKLTTDPATATAVATISSDGQSLDFRPPTGFHGTIIYQYTIDDQDPNTSSSTARVTIEVADITGGMPVAAASQIAQFGVDILRTDGTPTTMVSEGDDFLVRIYTQDLRPGGTFFDRGVLAAYMDLLFDASLVQPVSAPSNLLGFDINWALDPNMASGSSVVQASPTPTATSFSGSQGLPAQDSAFDRSYVQFTSGVLNGQSAQVLNYVGATRTFTFAVGAFTSAPGAGDQFSIRTPTYSFQESGRANVPAPGAIDEVGGTYFQSSSSFPAPGKGQVPAFTIRMHAKAAGTLTISPDPADSDANPDNRVLIIGTTPPIVPEVVTDEQVFLKPSTLTILPAGEGEFTNFTQPLDVSGDGFISALDALMVINDINANGPRSLSLLGLGLSGILPPENYLDVNADANVTPLDALLIINHLNSLLASSGSAGEGEAAPAPASDGGEGEGAPAGGAANLLAVTTLQATGTGSVSISHVSPLVLSSSTAPVGTTNPTHSSASGVSPLEVRLAKLQAKAADEVFTQLDIDQLRQSFRRHK